jgi:ABC-2 type transport system ATP-binding protein
MEEAERLCDHIAVMDAGRIVAAGPPQQLVADHARYVTVVFSTDAEDLGFLSAVPHVDRVMRHGARVDVRGDGPVLAHVASALVSHGITPPDLRVEQPTLEDVFLALTGHAMEE